MVGLSEQTGHSGSVAYVFELETHCIQGQHFTRERWTLPRIA